LPAIIFIAFDCLLAAGAAAQSAVPSPGQLVPRTYAPPIEFSPRQIDIPRSTVRAPPDAEKIQITIHSIVMDADEMPLPPEAQKLLSGLMGHSISVADVYTVAARIEQLYVALGYFLVRVLIPPQKVTNGEVLRIQVLSGFIERIDADSLPPRVRERVKSIVAPMVGQKPLMRETFERNLLLAGDVPGLALQAQLVAGETTGAVRLVLAGSDRLFSGDASIDNSMPAALGHSAAIVNIAANSVFGTGEQFYMSSGLAPGYHYLDDRNPRRLVAVGMRLPLGNGGWDLTGEYTWSQTHPLVPFGVLDTVSRYERYSVRLNDLSIRTRMSTLRTRLTFDATDEIQTAPAFDATLYDDKLRVFRAGLDWSLVVNRSTQLSTSFDLSRGIHGLGSRGQGQATAIAPLSQATGDDVFTKTEARVQVNEDLSTGLSLALTGRGQYAAMNPLLLSEKFALGGLNDLSSTTAGNFSGDRGWLWRLEMQYQMERVRIGENFAVAPQPYLFAARGQTTTLQATAAQLSVNGASSLGVGMRSKANISRDPALPLDLVLEAAQLRSDNPGVVPNAWRINASATLRF
jgi:hemolysin activation/secretion protein